MRYPHPKFPPGVIKTVEELRDLAAKGKVEKVFIVYSGEYDDIIPSPLKGLHFSKRKIEPDKVVLYFPLADHKSWWATAPDLWLPGGSGGWFVFSNFWYAWAYNQQQAKKKS